MRIAVALLLLSVSSVLYSQVKVPRIVAERLGKSRDFMTYARAMMQHIKVNQLKYPENSPPRVYYDKQEKYLARTLWYLESRQNKDGTIGNYARKTFEAFQQYQLQHAAGQLASATGNWNQLGPNNNASLFSPSTGIGRADRMAFHPSSANIIFAGTPSGGIFKSINGGDTWTNLNSFMPSLGVSGLVVSWADPDVIYALTGDGDSNLGDNGFVQGFDYIRPSIGVLKSTDGGQSWQLTGPLHDPDDFYVGFKLVQSPVNANILIAATSRGLYRTSNGGVSWSMVSSHARRFYDVEWKPGSSTRVYAASADTFYISDDAGASFFNQNNNIGNRWDSATRVAISVTPANPNQVWLLAGFTSYLSITSSVGVYRSSNSGDLFSRVNTANALVQTPEYMMHIATASNNSSVVLTGSLDLFRSSNAGASFTLANTRSDATDPNYVHADIHDIAFNPLDHALYIACDGGVYKSTDNGVTYAAKYVGFTASQFYHMDISSFNDDYVYAGAQDNGVMYRPGNTVLFQKVIGGDGYDVQFDNGSTTQAWASVNTNLYRTNAAFTDFDLVNGVGPGWYKRIVMSYSNNDLVFVSSGPIYRTNNGGTSWSDVGANGRWAMATCPSNSTRIYAAGGPGWNSQEDSDGIADKHLYRSDNAGSSWFLLDNKPGMPDSITRITSIEVSPSNSSQVWITMGGFLEGEKVFYSGDAGNNWINITGGLPNLPVNCIAIDANNDAYVGTDAGVYYRSSGMSNWQPYYNGLPQAPVTELIIRNGRIYAATFGRGVWWSDTKGPCPASISVTTPVSGIKYYEAVSINSSTTLRGGAGARLMLRAQSNVTLLPGFQANASTGEKFRAWIGNCGTGGIPQLSVTEAVEWMNAHVNNHWSMAVKSDSVSIEVKMPFDGGCSIYVLDNSGILSEILLHNKMLKAGNHSLLIPGNPGWKGKTLALMIDGQLSGVFQPKQY